MFLLLSFLVAGEGSIWQRGAAAGPSTARGISAGRCARLDAAAAAIHIHGVRQTPAIPH